ncbi:MAG: acido-empty-quinoprotein group A, partial [Acidobacteria bacterium]
MRVWASTLVLSLAPVVLCGQELTPEALVKPGTDSWPTYNGEYSGQRHSPLDQINGSNVASLALAWMYRASNYGAAGFGSVIKST